MYLYNKNGKKIHKNHFYLNKIVRTTNPLTLMGNEIY